MIALPFAPSQARYSATLASDGISTPVENGKSRFRRDFIGSSRIVNVQWSLNPVDYETLAYFFEYVTKSGTEPFEAELLIEGRSLETYTANLVPRSFRLSGVPGATRTCVARLEVEANQVNADLRASQALVQIASGGQSQTYKNLLENLVNVSLDQQAGLPNV